MVNYYCLRCGYSTNYKNNLRNHFNRKNPCNSILKDISIKKLKKMNFNDFCNVSQEENTKIQKASSEILISASQVPHNNSLITQNTSEKSLECKYCKRVFTRFDNLNRHINKYCKMKKSNEGELKKENLLLKKELYELKKQVEVLINKQINISNIQTNNFENSNINSNNSQITINNFGYENLDYISESVYKKLLNIPTTAITKLIEYKYFHPEHPENHNIKITNVHDKYAKIYKDNKWLLNHKKDLIEELVDNGYADFEEFKDLNEEELSAKVIEKYSLLEKKYKNKKNLIFKNTELSIINNSNKLDILENK